jgi:rubrerythrin
MIIDNDPSWNERWHEELLSISLLGKSSLSIPREDLKRTIRSIQKERSALYKPHVPDQCHSNSSYDYWIRDLKKRGVIEEENGELRLTNLGKWIARSDLGRLFERNSFLETFICKKCSSLISVVLLTPLLDTIDPKTVNVKKGTIWIDLRCPICSDIVTTKLEFNRDTLTRFYNQAVEELGQLVKLKAEMV